MIRPVPTLWKKIDDAPAHHQFPNGAVAYLNENLAGAVRFGQEIKADQEDKDRYGKDIRYNQRTDCKDGKTNQFI